MNDIPPHERNIGMVFQNYAIFPHLTVFENVAYGLKARKVPKKEIEMRVMEALEMVELAHLRDRMPSNMSGGQQQRISLARAIVIRPDILLMDEPLSNLDAKLRIKMRTDIRKLQEELGITTIYVTHDQEEALAVSDRIAVLRDGVIQQIASPRDIYLYPRNQFVANFIGETNFVEGDCSMADSADQAVVSVINRQVRLPLERAYSGKVKFSIRPERIRMSAEPTEQHSFAGTIKTMTFLGSKINFTIQLIDGQEIEVQVPSMGLESRFKEKMQVYLDLNLQHAIMYDLKGEEVIYRAPDEYGSQP